MRSESVIMTTDSGGFRIMKMKDFGFYRGVGLGGWFSQCDYSDERLDHFITE